MNSNPESNDPVEDSLRRESSIQNPVSSIQDDRSVERTFIFVRRTIIVAIVIAVGLVGWTAHVVNSGNERMVASIATTADLNVPAEGPGETADTLEVTSISMNSLPPLAMVNGQWVTKGESVGIQTPDGIVQARVVKITNGTVELKYKGERKAVTLTPPR